MTAVDETPIALVTNTGSDTPAQAAQVVAIRRGV
jgi:hypothetical protein